MMSICRVFHAHQTSEHSKIKILWMHVLCAQFWIPMDLSSLHGLPEPLVDAGHNAENLRRISHFHSVQQRHLRWM